jgi:hypothetical protein
MVRRAALAAAALAAALIAATAHAAVGTGVSYRATLTPREALFGDPLDARVDVAVDRGRVSPSTVRVHVDLRPYKVVSTTKVERATGKMTRVEFRYRLLCLDTRCLPGGPERTLKFAPVRISWRDDAGRRQTQSLLWPPVRQASRVDPRDLAEPTLRSDVVRQPAVTWGVKPSLVVTLLLLAAAALLAYPALLVARWARQRWHVMRTSRLERLSPLERALELLRRAASGGEDARSRRALERVARELRGHQLADDAERLAWSRPQPTGDDMDALRDRVEGGRST